MAAIAFLLIAAMQREQEHVMENPLPTIGANEYNGESPEATRARRAAHAKERGGVDYEYER